MPTRPKPPKPSASKRLQRRPVPKPRKPPARLQPGGGQLPRYRKRQPVTTAKRRSTQGRSFKSR